MSEKFKNSLKRKIRVLLGCEYATDEEHRSFLTFSIIFTIIAMLSEMLIIGLFWPFLESKGLDLNQGSGKIIGCTAFALPMLLVSIVWTFLYSCVKTEESAYHYPWEISNSNHNDQDESDSEPLYGCIDISFKKQADIKYYFTADLHFGSKETLARENRPFRTNEDFYEFVIDDFSSCPKDSVLYIIGDYVTYCDTSKMNKITLRKMFEMLSPVKAEIRLIIGNNEERIIKDLFHNDFSEFADFCKKSGIKAMKEDYITLDGRRFYLNHYPRNHKPGCVNLFGHVHRATGLYKPYGLNVGCDLNCYRLYSEKEILRLLEMKEKYWDNDPDVLDT